MSGMTKFLLATTMLIAASARADATADLFAKRCAGCHGGDGAGHTKLATKVKVPDFTSAKEQGDTTDKEIKDAITDGVKDSKMPAWKERLTAEEIAALSKYVRTLGPSKSVAK